MKRRRKRRRRLILKQQFAVFRVVNFITAGRRVPHEIFLGTVWAKTRADAERLAEEVFPRRALTLK